MAASLRTPSARSCAATCASGRALVDEHRARLRLEEDSVALPDVEHDDAETRAAAAADPPGWSRQPATTIASIAEQDGRSTASRRREPREEEGQKHERRQTRRVPSTT